MIKNKTFSTQEAKNRDYTMKANIASVTTSRLRVTISQRAAECVDYIQARIPIVFSLDEMYVASRQDAIRFTIQFLSLLANQSGIYNTKTSIKKHEKYFLHDALKDGENNESIDLTPASDYIEANSRSNLTFTTSQNDDFLLLKKIYKQKGVKSNNHLVEEIIFSMAACILALDEGYAIDTLPTAFSLDGFGHVQISSFETEEDLVSTGTTGSTVYFLNK